MRIQEKDAQSHWLLAKWNVFSIPVTQRPSNQGRLRAEHEIRGCQLYPEVAPVIHSSIADGFWTQNKSRKKTQDEDMRKTLEVRS